MTTADALVLGLDIGGTSTRALVAGLDGERVATGRGPGANITSHAPETAIAAIESALRAALTHVDDPTRIQRAVIGTAGNSNLLQPTVAEALRQTWSAVGLTCSYGIVSDAMVAFIAGTPEPDGTLLLAGTGALATAFRRRQRMRTADGHGWLLGDLGSGFWLGKEAVRSTLAALERHEVPGPLGLAVLHAHLWPDDDPSATRERVADIVHTEAVSTTLDRGDSLVARLIVAAHARPPVTLAGLAPLVSSTAGADPEADRILAEAAGHLLDAVATVRATGDANPIVLAGSLLTTDNPVRRLVQPELAARWPDAPITTALDGAAGAAWLAAGALLGPTTLDAAELHTRLLGRQSVSEGSRP
ncbi:N-acetylglucosamine kinase [Phytoactinopolyspora halotolerans]|uniref:ATPase n=1 Tax=Phytoactinopolyspora halotolerans TaxID=1981512 RepID=A0A6L9S7C9_9ACTN|nr:BadF/BadG/BcrA/BcrD ATPase family protein [Phytoactinopolyspora halotolerans]NEE01385.1 ATPase [Phytoactinopolyspora halotolerans]